MEPHGVWSLMVSQTGSSDTGDLFWKVQQRSCASEQSRRSFARELTRKSRLPSCSLSRARSRTTCSPPRRRRRRTRGSRQTRSRATAPATLCLCPAALSAPDSDTRRPTECRARRSSRPPTESPIPCQPEVLQPMRRCEARRGDVGGERLDSSRRRWRARTWAWTS